MHHPILFTFYSFFFLLFFMHQLAPNAILHFYVPPHFICLLLLFFLLFFMYQLTQIPFQNFFSILCTNRSPSPFDFHSSETSADPHHDTDTQHQSTPAPRHTRRHVPTPPSALPYSQPYLRTTAPLHRTPKHITANTTYHTPRRMISWPHSSTIPTPAGRIDAVPTQHRRGPRRDQRARRCRRRHAACHRASPPARRRRWRRR